MAGRYVFTPGRRAALARNRKKRKNWGSSPYHRSYANGRYLTKKQSRNKKIATRTVAIAGATTAVALASIGPTLAYTSRTAKGGPNPKVIDTKGRKVNTRKIAKQKRRR